MDMRERIARALFVHDEQDGGCNPGDKMIRAWFEDDDPDNVETAESYRKQADAVLATLQEPTDEMIRAGVGRQINHDWNNALPSDLSQMRDCWYNMIHAAAKEKETA